MLEKSEKPDLSRFLDDWDCLDKVYGRDGGDSCHRDFMYQALIQFMGKENRSRWPLNDEVRFSNCLRYYNPAPGILRRHPDPDRDASDWDRGSRDQAIPYLISLSLWCRKEQAYGKRLRSFWFAHLKRGFFFHNRRMNGANKRNHGLKIPGTNNFYDYTERWPDISDPEVFGLMIRGLGWWFFYPLLFLVDFTTLIGALHIKYTDKNIVMNHALISLYASKVYPTGLIWLANRLLSPSELAKRMRDHFGDFGGPEKDMSFLADMYLVCFIEGNGK